MIPDGNRRWEEAQVAFRSVRRIGRPTALPILVAALAMTCSISISQAQVGAEARLKERNIVLPAPPKPVGNYVEWVRVGNLLYLAGHGGAQARGKGKVGRELTP